MKLILDNKLIISWNSFAQHGNPTPEDNAWAPVEGGNDSKHFDISADGPELKSDSAEYQRRGRFWDKVFEEHPPLLHYRQSPTFKNTRMHRRVGEI